MGKKRSGRVRKGNEGRKKKGRKEGLGGRGGDRVSVEKELENGRKEKGGRRRGVEGSGS